MVELRNEDPEGDSSSGNSQAGEGWSLGVSCMAAWSWGGRASPLELELHTASSFA